MYKNLVFSFSYRKGWLSYLHLTYRHIFNEQLREESVSFSGVNYSSFLKVTGISVSSGQSLSHVRLFVTPMNCSMPGFPVHHQLPEFTQTHVHWVHDTIQPSHPLSSPSPPDFNLSQHQGLFWWVSFSHQVAKVLEFQLQGQSFQWIFRSEVLEDWLVGKGLSRVFSNTTVQKHQFFGTQFSL